MAGGSRAVIASAAVCTFLFARAARADAQSLFEAARNDLRQGDYAAAYPKLVESERLDPSNGTLLNLVLCEDRLGKLASAWRHAQALVPQLPTDDERSVIAARELADLDARVPRLTVRLRGSATDGATLAVDGTPVPLTPWGTVLPLDTGEHTLHVAVPGRLDYGTSITLAAGQRAEWTVEVPAIVAPAPVERRGAPRAVAWTALGVGAAGLITGVVLGALSMSKRAQVLADCPDKQCRRATSLDAASDGQRLFVGSAIAIGVGALGAGAGVYLLTRPDGGSSLTGVVATYGAPF